MPLTLGDIGNAANVVYRFMQPTPQYRWAQLNQRLGVDMLLKHENHTPLGAFKVRGGLVYFEAIAETIKEASGSICATRGNHGQSVAYASAIHEVPCTVVVPHGNSTEKNAAMRALGARLIEHGHDFQDALEHAESLAVREKLHMVPSFHPHLVAGVATYSLELLRSAPELEALFIPIGLGSGICGAIAVRNALGLQTDIIGVVSSEAPAYKKSFMAGKPIVSEVTTRLADGMACRVPNPLALEFILEHVTEIVEVSDDEIAQAMRDIFECTHNVAEGAGAAAVAAVKNQAALYRDKHVAAVLCGGNVDRSVFAEVLSSSN